MALDEGSRSCENGRVKLTSILLALVVAAVGFWITAFTRPAGSEMPPADVLPSFAVLLLLESLALGAGVAYVLRRRSTLFGGGTAALERAVSWIVAYLLLAPWIHDYLHGLVFIDGVFNWPALAVVEYLFHLGIAPIGVVLAAYLLRSRPRAVLPT